MNPKSMTKAELVEKIEKLEKKVAQLEGTDPPAQLEHQESLFRKLAESTSAHITILQEDRYLYANQAFLDYHMLESADLQLITPAELMMGVMTPEAMKKAEPAWRAAVESGQRQVHFEMEDLEGNWFHTTVCMMELDGKSAFMITDTDVTEMKRAQQEMVRTDKLAALGQIVAGVAHEINNPNNFIYFNIPVLRKYLDAMMPLLDDLHAAQPDLEILGLPAQEFQKDIYKLLEDMEHGSARITSIVSALKKYVQNDSVGTWKVGQVSQVVDAVMNLIGKQITKMVKRFELDIKDDLAALRMNPGKIEQVLTNLLINAAQAADKDDSWIKLTAQPAQDNKDFVELVIEDNGAGISKRNLEKIFEPFFTSKGPDQGTGLGLSISHRIVEEHQGSISVTSQPGQGSCFVVRLPVAVEETTS